MPTCPSWARYRNLYAHHLTYALTQRTERQRAIYDVTALAASPHALARHSACAMTYCVGGTMRGGCWCRSSTICFNTLPAMMLLKKGCGATPPAHTVPVAISIAHSTAYMWTAHLFLLTLHRLLDTARSAAPYRLLSTIQHRTGRHGVQLLSQTFASTTAAFMQLPNRCRMYSELSFAVAAGRSRDTPATYGFRG